jgi:hypothetical protein
MLANVGERRNGGTNHSRAVFALTRAPGLPVLPLLQDASFGVAALHDDTSDRRNVDLEVQLAEASNLSAESIQSVVPPHRLTARLAPPHSPHIVGIKMIRVPLVATPAERFDHSRKNYRIHFALQFWNRGSMGSSRKNTEAAAYPQVHSSNEQYADRRCRRGGRTTIATEMEPRPLPRSSCAR